MLYFNINGYADFKQRFGMRETNNGKMVRQNSILLSYIKYEFKARRFENVRVKDVGGMRIRILNQLKGNNIRLMGHSFGSEVYSTDTMEGVCDDQDARSVRYIRLDNGRVFKMKAGKFMRKLLTEHKVDACEQALTYICEKFADDWFAHASQYMDDYQLHVDDNFWKIYDTDECEGNFQSCMMDDGQYSFYENAVAAEAAYLTNDDGNVVARCIIFNNVWDMDDGKALNLAERQYSTDGDNKLKQILVNKLIEGGYIDGYKAVGVDCHNSRAYVGVDGESWANKRFRINCNLDFGDTLSYQDSFKWYDHDNRLAYNYSGCNYTDMLDDTESIFGGDTVEVHVWRGDYYTTEEWDRERAENYAEEYNGEYYDELAYCERYNEDFRKDEVIYSDWNDDWIPEDEAEYCEEAGEYFWKDRYYEEFEEWKKDHWDLDEYNNEYVEDVEACMIWDAETEEYKSMNVEVGYAEENFYWSERDNIYYSREDWEETAKEDVKAYDVEDESLVPVMLSIGAVVGRKYRYCKRYQTYFSPFGVIASYTYSDNIPIDEVVMFDTTYGQDAGWADRMVYDEETGQYFPNYDTEGFVKVWKKNHWKWSAVEEAYKPNVIRVFKMINGERYSKSCSLEYARKNMIYYNGIYWDSLEGIPGATLPMPISA